MKVTVTLEVTVTFWNPFMYFKAISIGYAVPRTDFDAAVHSVFQSAVNLRLKSGDNLLTFVASSEADLPQGIRVDAPDDFSFEIFRAGEQVTCRDDILRFVSTALTIDLRGSERFDCNLSSLQADMTIPAVATAWLCVWQALNKRQIQTKAEIIAQNIFRPERTLSLSKRQSKDNSTDALRLWRILRLRSGRASAQRESIVAEKAGEAMRGLFAATQRFDLTFASSLNALIGLGAGLTPSGDDLLVGYLTGLWCAVLDKSERARFVSSLGEAIIRLSGQTNDISRTYLYHAARGQVSSRLVDLADAICQGENSDGLLPKAKSAMQVGHTSGMDAVTGLLVGLATWDPPVPAAWVIRPELLKKESTIY